MQTIYKNISLNKYFWGEVRVKGKKKENRFMWYVEHLDRIL